MRGKKEQQQKKSTRALYFCYILFLSLIIDVIMRGKRSPIFILPISLCPVFLFLLAYHTAQRCGILGQEAPHVASGAPVGSACSSGEMRRYQRSW